MRRGTLLVLGAAFFWGTTFPGTKYGLNEGGFAPVPFLFYRFLVALAILVAFAAWRRRFQTRLLWDWQVWMFGLLNALGYLLQYVGQEITTASKTSLLVNVNVLVTALLAWVVLRERIGPTLFVGIAIGFVGITLLATNGDFRTLSPEFTGDLLALGTGMCWTAIILWVKHYLNMHPDTDTLSVNILVIGVAVTCFFVAGAARGDLAYEAAPAGLPIVLYLGVCATALAFVMWQEGLRDISAAASSILLLFETIVALVVSILFLDERLSGWTGAGAALVLIAMYLASRQAPPVPEPEAAIVKPAQWP